MNLKRVSEIAATIIVGGALVIFLIVAVLPIFLAEHGISKLIGRKSMLDIIGEDDIFGLDYDEGI